MLWIRSAKPFSPKSKRPFVQCILKGLPIERFIAAARLRFLFLFFLSFFRSGGEVFCESAKSPSTKRGRSEAANQEASYGSRDREHIQENHQLSIATGYSLVFPTGIETGCLLEVSRKLKTKWAVEGPMMRGRKERVASQGKHIPARQNILNRHHPLLLLSLARFDDILCFPI